MKSTMLAIGLYAFFGSMNAFANAPILEQTVIAPNCLLNNTSVVYTQLGRNDEFTLLQADVEQLAELTLQAHQQVEPCGKYLDVTAKWHQYSAKNIAPDSKDFLQQFANPKTNLVSAQNTYEIKHKEIVNNLLSDVQPDRFWDDLKELSNTDHNHFPDRSAFSETGLKTSHWLKDKVLDMAKAAGRTDVSAELLDIGKYCRYSQCLQKSVIVKISNNSENPAIVVGAHMDTLGGYKPGADDDGSGSVTVLELARVLLNSKQSFDRPVYLIWYAAEERGLWGSQSVVNHFINQKIAVKSVLHLDMTGFQNNTDAKRLWLIGDNVNHNLSEFVKNLALTYAGVDDVKYTYCGYACSDHASWTRGGFESSMPSESDFHAMNQHIHKSSDLMKYLNKDHMTKYAKLAVAFVGELATK